MNNEIYRYLSGMVTSIDTIILYTHGINQNDFVNRQEPKTTDAIFYQLIVLAEYYSKIKHKNANFIEQNTVLPNDFAGLAAIRTFLAHDFSGINPTMIWKGIERLIPLRQEIVRLQNLL